ncbi:MAG: hypothetical protein HKM93_21570, partial [Desulfobacteraceae bacterium]|nr:hypothetical protein [Desulfobacteraceae bacterium]
MFSILVLLSDPATGLSADKPFNNPSNWGGTGLFEIPNARILDDGELRLGFATADPYDWYVLGIGVLPFLECDIRYTEINEMPSGLPEFGDFKDKAFDVKLQLVPESRYLPAVALGLQDVEGTELFSSKYIALSRQIYPFDFTVGAGTGRLNGIHAPFTDRFGLFAGIEWAVNDRLTMAAEYSPIDYAEDPRPVRALPEGTDSSINVGMKLKLTSALSVGMSWQRGDTLGFMGHLRFPLGKPLLPKRPDPKEWRFLVKQPHWRLTSQQMVDGALNDLIKTRKFTNIEVSVEGRSLIAEVENNRYLSNTKAAGRAFRILLHYANSDMRKLVVKLSRRGIPVISVSVTPQHLRDYLTARLSMDLFRELIEVVPAEPSSDLPPDTVASQSTSLLTEYGIDPQVTTIFDQTTAELQSRFSLIPHATLQPWVGNALVGRLDIPLYSNVDASTDLPPEPVRSDTWKYADSGAAFARLMDDQVLKLSDRIYSRLSSGYLERMYAGVGGELLTFIGDGSFAVGLEADWVRKREPDELFGLQDVDSHTILGNIYYYFSPLNLTLQTQVGRFLAGDEGFRFQMTRRYDTGAQMGFWLSLTDTEDLTGFNKGYEDKGMFIQIPLSMFFNSETRRQFAYSVSPWTRDVGATVDHWQSL